MRLILTCTLGALALVFLICFFVKTSFSGSLNFPTIGAVTDAKIFDSDAVEVSKIPIKSWDFHFDDGIAVAMVLKEAETVPSTYCIDVFIKNTSYLDKYFFAINSETVILYLDQSNAQQPLKESYKKPAVNENVIIPIKPGQILLRTVSLSSDELLIVKQRPVQCLLRIGNGHDKEIKIVSAPLQLSPSL